MYKPALLDKPQVLLINKMDSDGAKPLYEEAVERIQSAESKFFHYSTHQPLL